MVILYKSRSSSIRDDDTREEWRLDPRRHRQTAHPQRRRTDRRRVEGIPRAARARPEPGALADRQQQRSPEAPGA